MDLVQSHNYVNLWEQQKKKEWKQSMGMSVSDRVGKRVGILGYGSIGRQGKPDIFFVKSKMVYLDMSLYSQVLHSSVRLTTPDCLFKATSNAEHEATEQENGAICRLQTPVSMREPSKSSFALPLQTCLRRTMFPEGAKAYRRPNSPATCPLPLIVRGILDHNISRCFTSPSRFSNFYRMAS